MRGLLVVGFLLTVAIVSFTGCGFKQYRYPCEFDVRVRLERDTNRAHETCRKVMHSCPDRGCEFTAVERAAGCADVTRGKIVVVDQDFVITHEMRHMFDKNCL